MGRPLRADGTSQSCETYGPRFFYLVVVDSWYTNGPFLKTVVEELGWPLIAVLKQERYEIYQEALALTRGKPGQVVERGERPNQHRVEIWDVPSVGRPRQSRRGTVVWEKSEFLPHP